MPTDNEIFESDENGLGTLDRDEEPEISSPNENLQDKLKNLGISSPIVSKNKSLTETEMWLDYVGRLDPDDEAGAFLTPADLKAVDEAYARLQLSDPGTPNFPGNKARVASSADEEFIKKKMATALERAQKVATEEQQLNVVLESIRQRKTNRVNVLEYQRGWISGKCLVLLPKGETIEKNFTKEKGWKAEVEIFVGEEKTTQTIFARGICMNVITGEALRQTWQNLTFDYSGIEFEPMGKPDPSSLPFSETQFTEEEYPEEESPMEGFFAKLSKFFGL
jgi:hypothetical protein